MVSCAMRGCGLVLALAFSISGQATADARIVVTDETGTLLTAFEVRDGEQWCLVWNHSVAGFPVRDCFVRRSTTLVLDSSHQPDFAAGLGHYEGRGTMVADARGGYRIEAIDEPVPDNRLRLRVGSAAVDHRIEHAAGQFSLSAVAEHRRVQISLFDSSEGPVPMRTP
ncbi:DUF1850 domain-containing protein [Rhodocyclaceae bacterium SMB388]